LHEGLWKYHHASFSAEPFLRQARGPFASWYRGLVPDYFGQERLNLKAMTERWQRYQNQFAEHYRFDEKQRAAADVQRGLAVRQLQGILMTDDQPAVLKPEIVEYHRKLAAWRAAERASATRDIPYQQQRHYEALNELQRLAAPYLAEVDKIDARYRDELNQLATPQQVSTAGQFVGTLTTLDYLEELTTYSLMAIGLCLMVGLLTRIASLGGAVFMLTAVVLPQIDWPPSYPPLPPSAGHSLFVTKEVIEMLALLALAATPVGRWGGLDYILHHGLFRPLFGSKEASS
jgi:uncharacterized membrane protein YphA (DoxX/SURF4 family)